MSHANYLKCEVSIITKVCAHGPGRTVKLMWNTYKEAFVSYNVLSCICVQVAGYSFLE